MSAQGDCLFCKIIAGELPAHVVAQDDRTIAFLDINPASSGHALVVPRAHSRDLLEVGPEDLAAVASSAQRVAAAMHERLGADGVNLINSCGAAWRGAWSHWATVLSDRPLDASSPSRPSAGPTNRA